MEYQAIIVIRPFVGKGRFKIDEGDVRGRSKRSDFAKGQRRVFGSKYGPPHSPREHHVTGKDNAVVRQLGLRRKIANRM